MISKEQEQIILGTLLGSGFLCKSTHRYLCIQHSKKFEQYLRMKVDYLRAMARPTPFYYRGNVIGWRSSCALLWDDFYDFCYKDNQKTIHMDWLDQLRAIGLAIWYCDSGTLIGHKKRNICLKTQNFGEGNQIIQQYFEEIGIPCSLNKSKKSWIVVFNDPESIEFLKIVAPYIPKCLHRRLIPA